MVNQSHRASKKNNYNKLSLYYYKRNFCNLFGLQPWPPKLGLPGLVTFKAELSGKPGQKSPAFQALKI